MQSSNLRQNINWFVLTVIFLAVVLRVVYWFELLDTSFLQYPIFFKNSDMHLTYIKALGIAQGDFLGKNLDVFMTDWMREIAPEETWIRWSGGRQVYHREPLYEYWVASWFFLGGFELQWVLAAQLALGVLMIYLVWDFVQLVFGKIVAGVSSIVAAFYGPLFFYQATLLRDSFFVFFQILLVWILVRWECSAKYKKFYLFFAGCISAVLFQVKASSVLFVLGMFAMLVVAKQDKKIFPQIGFYLLGVTLCLMPLALRNWSLELRSFQVGSPLAPTLIAGFAPGSGVFTLRASSDLKPWLLEVDGTTAGVVKKLIDAYREQPSLFFEKILQKILAVLQSVEISDNLNYEYASHLNSIFLLLPTWQILSPLAILGLLMIFFDRRKFSDYFWVLVWVITCSSSLMIVPMGRYRLELVIPCAILAGFFVDSVYGFWTNKKSTEALALIFMGLLGILLWPSFSSMSFMEETHNRFRFVEYGVSGMLYATQARFEDERMEYRSYIRQFEAFAQVKVSPDVHALIVKSYLDEIEAIKIGETGELPIEKMENLLKDAREESMTLNARHKELMDRLNSMEASLKLHKN